VIKVERHEIYLSGGTPMLRNSRPFFMALSMLAIVLFVVGTAVVAYADNGKGQGRGSGGPPPSDNFTGGQPPSDNMTHERPPMELSDNMTGGHDMWDSSDNMTASVLKEMASILDLDEATVISAFDEAVETVRPAKPTE